MNTTCDYRALAEQAAGNHFRFTSFAWFGAPDEDADQWTIVYTSNRDSGALDKANARVVAQRMEPFGDDCRAETHNHWACGYVDGFAIRVYSDGEVTAAFREWCDIQAELADYPVLDESVLSEIEQAEIEESWDCWIRHDFQRAIEQAWGIDLEASDSDLRSLFDDACSEASEYPQHSGNEVVCDLEAIVEAVSEESLKQFVPAIGIKLYRDGVFYCGGELRLLDYACDMPIYHDEFLAAMEARELGLDSVQIGAHRFDWTLD